MRVNLSVWDIFVCTSVGIKMATLCFSSVLYKAIKLTGRKNVNCGEIIFNFSKCFIEDVVF